ncbi:uncharacterized protein EI97DRAFT_455391 [Westerdykella ornata]|uniref:Uncharacterized protein n=1 Tax=Westerdykella ornata TaxID=318751 RepID=A0A6A6JV58_WESOR|nr:uncharacterized protein EI97DRAFT_455391 [Westerdykella ornata]KAF2280501.1 hypothetical protein EI97DRAFT_455391 [Westerdykella ornata]
MSFMIDFPWRPLPADAHQPPYALFAIGGQPIPAKDFPARIPLGLFLHFAPIAEQWLIDVPSRLPVPEKKLILHKRYVGIDIPGFVPKAGLQIIVRRMVQLSGRVLSSEDFETSPSILDSLRVVVTWRKLQLPAKGLEGTEMHLHSRLSMGRPVKLDEVKAVWDVYPPPSTFMKEALLNFIHAYVNRDYSAETVTAIRTWIQTVPDLKAFFAQMEGEYKTRVQLEDPTVHLPVETTPGPATNVEPSKTAEIVESGGIRRATPGQRRDSLKGNLAGMKPRLRRMKSDPPLRSIHDEDDDSRTNQSGPTGRPRSAEIHTRPYSLSRAFSFIAPMEDTEEPPSNALASSGHGEEIIQTDPGTS